MTSIATLRPIFVSYSREPTRKEIRFHSKCIGSLGVLVGGARWGCLLGVLVGGDRWGCSLGVLVGGAC